MILWFTIVQVAVAVLAGVFAVASGAIGRKPDDLSLGALLLVEILLIAQLVVAIVAPEAGNPPTGSVIEFYVYLVCALIIPPASGFWALIERSRWSTVILGIAALAVAVMVYRMYQIWHAQA